MKDKTINYDDLVEIFKLALNGKEDIKVEGIGQEAMNRLLLMACLEEKFEICRALLKAGVDANYQLIGLWPYERFGVPILHRLLIWSYLRLVTKEEAWDKLRKILDDNEDEQKELKRKELVHKEGYKLPLELVKILVEEGRINLELEDERERTILRYALAFNRYDIAEYLLKQGAKIRPIYLLNLSDNYKAIEFLLKQGISTKEYGGEALCANIERDCDLEKECNLGKETELLIKSGVSPNFYYNFKYMEIKGILLRNKKLTPLQYAVICENIELARFLLENNADINAKVIAKIHESDNNESLKDDKTLFKEYDLNTLKSITTVFDIAKFQRNTQMQELLNEFRISTKK